LIRIKAIRVAGDYVRLPPMGPATPPPRRKTDLGLRYENGAIDELPHQEK